LKKVLIITYYWPPGGGGGVQRWLKFVKYLRSFNWEPVVFTPENPEWPSLDKSLADEIPAGVTVLRNKIWEPYSFYKKLTGKSSEEKIQTAFLSEKKQKNSLLENLAVWIRGNLFIPDARKYWIKPSVKYLSNYLKNNKIDVVVSTGPPHSAHLIGLYLKQKMGVTWLADFRDPWTNIDYYRDLKLGKRAHKKHQELEKKVLERADGVTVISPGMERNFKTICARKYHTIPNGFDAGDMVGLDKVKPEKDKFVFAHIGSLTRTRNPVSLWKALQQLVTHDEEFAKKLEIRNIGKMDVRVLETVKKSGLEKYVQSIDYLPHNQVLIEQRKAAVLLLLINDTPNAELILTGKLFEYLAAKRSIICIGPKNGDAAKVIQRTGAGIAFDFKDVEGIKKSLLQNFHRFNKGKYEVESFEIQGFERKNLTKEMAAILDELTSQPKVSGLQNS